MVVRAAVPSLAPRACVARTCRPSCSLEFVDAYQQLLDAAPFPTKALTQGVIWGMSDITAQVQARGAFSAQRTRNFALQGVGSGVLWALYYDWADAVVSPAPGGPVAHTVRVLPPRPLTNVHCLRKPPRSCAHGASVAALLVRFSPFCLSSFLGARSSLHSIRSHSRSC